METVSVILTRYTDPFSRLLYLATGFGYTHASISLDWDGDRMYSFNVKGFCEETLARHRRRGVKRSMCMQLKISDGAYRRLQARIEQFKANRAQYSYTKLGVVMSFLHIPFRREKRYFCSQFVAELLSDTGAVKLRKASYLYMPQHFVWELMHSGQLQGMWYNLV